MILILHAILKTVPFLAHGSINTSPEAVEKWFEEELPHAKEKLTKLRFYFHDIVSGNNPTVVRVAQANTSNTSPTFFGVVAVMDDPLTLGPVPTSERVGSAKGIYTFASQEDFGLLMAFNFVFTGGKYNGSTLSVLGHNRLTEKYREFPVVGGSGVFRLARGVAAAKTYIFNTSTGDAVVEYNVMVLHY